MNGNGLENSKTVTKIVFWLNQNYGTQNYGNQNYGNQTYCEPNLLALRYIYDNQIVVRFTSTTAFTLINVFCCLPLVAEAKRSRIINNCTINIIVTIQIRDIRISDMKFLPSCD